MNNPENTNPTSQEALYSASTNLAGSASDIRFLVSATYPNTDDVKTQISSFSKELGSVLNLVETDQDIDPNQIYIVSDKLSETTTHLDVISAQLSTLGFSVEDRLSIYTEISEGIINLEQKNRDFLSKNDPDGSIKKIHQLDESTSPDIKEFLITQTSMIQQLKKENSVLSKKLDLVENKGKESHENYQKVISDLEHSRDNNKSGSISDYFEDRKNERELEQLKKDVEEQKELERERHGNRGFFDTLLND